MKSHAHSTLKLSSAITVLVAALAAAPAFAADKAPAPTGNDDVIIVTGSLITNPNVQRSTEVNVTTAQEIRLQQSNNAEELLRSIPGIVANLGSGVNNGANGSSQVDLRGLGSKRNLVLLDGNRVPPYNTDGTVNLDIIPLALVDRVEVLSGGAATTYGADAVSGVVNYILKKKFTGLELSANDRITGKGDGNYKTVDLTVGTNFAGGRGNITLSGGYQTSNAVYQGGRGYSANSVDSYAGTGGGSSTTVPTVFSVKGVGSEQLNAAGTGLTTTVTPFNFNPYNLLQDPFLRYNAYASASYEFSDKLEFYTRGLYSQTTVSSIIAPSGIFGSSVTIPYSNPYLPAGVAQTFCNANGLTPTQCSFAIADKTGAETFSTVVKRRLVEASGRESDWKSDFFDYRAGFRGHLSSDLSWDINGSYGENRGTQTNSNYVLTSAARQALLATNTTSCLNTATNPFNGQACVPLNIFGPAGSISAAQYNFLLAPGTIEYNTSLAQARGVVNWSSHIHSPFATHGINVAAGVEYRRVTAAINPDALDQTAGQLGGGGAAIPPFGGAIKSTEFYGEVNVPLIEDKPFFESVNLTGGIRRSHYNNSGYQVANGVVNTTGDQSSYSTTTWKGEFSWVVEKGIKFRANYAHAVRAPNFGELFQPQVTGLDSLKVDPCAGAAPTTNANLRAICLAQGAPAGTIGNIQNPSAAQPDAVSGGNPQLQPEVADSFGLGIVITPAQLRGLTLTADYGNVIVNGAVSSPTPNDVINGCFGNITSASATSAACTTTRRNPVTGGLDGAAIPGFPYGLYEPLSNLGRIRTNWLDFTVNYTGKIHGVKLSTGLTGTYTFHNFFQATPSSLDRDCVGFYSANCGSPQPQIQWNERTTLSFKSVDLSVNWRHLGALNQEPADIANNGAAFVGVLTDPADGPLVGSTVNFGHIKAYDYIDMTVVFHVEKRFELTFKVANLFDLQPPLVGSSVGSTAYDSGNTYPSTYDPTGRKFTAGVRVRF